MNGKFIDRRLFIVFVLFAVPIVVGQLVSFGQQLREPKLLFKEFNSAKNAKAKLKLLPQLTKAISDDKIPDEVRYLLALQLLRPHLAWHAPYLPPIDKSQRKFGYAKGGFRDSTDDPWREAHTGESWMWKDIPAKTRKIFDKALEDWRNAQPNELKPLGDLKNAKRFFWRIRNCKHPDVARALKLLAAVSGKSEHSAKRWIHEIKRNNTVVTFDIPDSGGAGKDFPVVMDVRNAEKVSFKLYRVQRPEDVLWSMGRIGKDFIYRDYALQYIKARKVAAIQDSLRALERVKSVRKQTKQKMPTFGRDSLVHQWDVSVAQLKMVRSRRFRNRHWDDWRRWDHEDYQYFNDDCWEFASRLGKRYRPHRYQPSSWQCDRIVEVPGKALVKTGAYILIAESNGQSAYAPIIIDALSLTMRRCRDGVFVLVSDNEGKRPIAGAQIIGKKMLGKTVTDANGAAFAKIFAAGDRAIVVHHKGRFAIGGFGRVFDGIYVSPLDRDRYWDMAWRGGISRLTEKLKSLAQVYADRHVVAAYTDRPTYRPGQKVQFKLIIRKLAPLPAEKSPSIFRPEMDPAKVMMPDTTNSVRFSMLDPKGRIIHKGELKLSEFATAAGDLILNTEAVLGSYAMRVHVAGKSRIVPDVFAVKAYRRPNFALKVTGAPGKLKEPKDITCTVTGAYYFGKPVTKGKVHVRLVQSKNWKPLAESEATTDASGKAKVSLKLPKRLNPGKYFIVSSLTDDSGRTVSEQSTIDLIGDDPFRVRSGLAALPRFVKVNEPVRVNLPAQKVIAEREKKSFVFPAKSGMATLKFSVPGWYRLTAGNEATELFVYGGEKHPFELTRKIVNDKTPRWVNLSDYGWQEHGRPSRCENPDQHILALFDRQHVQLGKKLRLLVWAACKRARLVFTMEGETVADYFATDSKASAGWYHVVEIPIKKRHLPNFYLQGRVITGMELVGHFARREYQKEAEELLNKDEAGDDPRWCRIDVLDPNGNKENDKLKVTVTPNRTKFRPGETVDVQLKVTDRNGRPRIAEVSLGAVDASVYTFGEDGVNGLSRFFAAPRVARRFRPGAWRSALGNRWRGSDIRSQEKAIRELMKAQGSKAGKSGARAELLRQLREETVDQREMPRPLAAINGEMPATQISLARLRLDFRETAVWQPQLRTGEDGAVKTSFRLPDSLTKFRLTVVALTKQTEIGVGRANVQISQPLAVQLFVPRFAVEKDRHLATALIHNNTEKIRVCVVQWNIKNGSLDGPSAGQVVVPANATARATVWLKTNQIGVATLTVRAGDRQHSDAEVRSLPVYPLGRAAEVAHNGKLEPIPAGKNGKFNLQKQIRLPNGFVATDLRLSLSNTETVQALNGLGYLVEYPYGCIEQTMSRFLPAVMVKHACRKTPAELPPDVAAKLPDILEKGLTRIYGFQHDDGSWGWFKKDKNVPMTVYVVYGLARCKSTGTPVNGMILDHGCQFLSDQLRSGNLPPDLAARSWLALALAGRIVDKELKAFALQCLAKDLSPATNANLALACRSAKLKQLGALFWKRARNWQARTASELALKLNMQIAFGEKWTTYRKTANRLLALRRGDRWQHTRATSWAIEALAGMLAHVPNKVGVRGVKVAIGGKTAMTVNDPRDLKKLVHTLRHSAAHLAGKEALMISMSALSDEPIYFVLRATGVRRLDKVQPTGKRIKVRRFLETTDGKPLQGAIKVGRIVRVRLQLELERDEQYLLIEDRLPAGCEFAGDRIEGRIAHDASHVEFRDDRVCVFNSRLLAGRHEIIYYLRAETPGVSHVLPGCVYPMYEETIRGETGALQLEIGR